MTVIRELEDDERRQLFEREISALLQLRHPGILHLIGASQPAPEDPDEPQLGWSATLVTEYLPQGDLAKMIKRRHLDMLPPDFGPTEFSKVIFGIPAVMAYIHRMGFVHRDLKPANILLDARGELRIADFGLARIVDLSLSMTGGVGSRLFMAPELLDRSRRYQYNEKVDVYAYGMLLYCICTQPTFFASGEKIRDEDRFVTLILHGQRLQRPPVGTGCTPAIWNLIKACCEGDAASRLSFQDILVEMQRSDEYALPGTDMTQYSEYQHRITIPLADLPAHSTSRGSFRAEAHTEGGLTTAHDPIGGNGSSNFPFPADEPQTVLSPIQAPAPPPDDLSAEIAARDPPAPVAVVPPAPVAVVPPAPVAVVPLARATESPALPTGDAMPAQAAVRPPAPAPLLAPVAVAVAVPVQAPGLGIFDRRLLAGLWIAAIGSGIAFLLSMRRAGRRPGHLV
jgi:serine/threonine protein kinase